MNNLNNPAEPSRFRGINTAEHIIAAGTGGWIDVDISADVPANAQVLGCRLYSASIVGTGLRQKTVDAAVAPTVTLAGGASYAITTGCDVSKIVQVLRDALVEVRLYVYGYWL